MNDEKRMCRDCAHFIEEGEYGDSTYSYCEVRDWEVDGDRDYKCPYYRPSPNEG